MRILALTGLALAVASLALVACGDDDDGGGNGAPAGTAGAGAGGSGGGTGGSAGVSTGVATLSGTWDLVGSYQRDGSGFGSLRLSDKDFSFTYGEGSDAINVSSIRFDATAGALIAFDSRFTPSDTLTGTRQAGEALRLGAMPLPIDGTWTLAASDDPDRACFTSLSKAAFGLRCQGVDDLPDWEGASALALTHVAEAPSMFGDLGGTWRGTKVLRDSPESSCELRFEGGDVTLACTKLSLFTGTLRVSFNGNRASGSTNTGLEFAGTRRLARRPGRPIGT